MGGLFVNYFNRFGRQWQVYVEAEGDYRTKSENVGQFYVRNCGRRNGPAVRADADSNPATAPSSPCASTNIARRN